MSILGVLRRLTAIPGIVRALRRGREEIDGIEVYGRQEFRRSVIGALLLLRHGSLPAWNTLTRHVGSILEGSTTEAVVTARPAFMLIGEPYAGQEPRLLAGAIAFMACSIQLHRTYEAEFPGRRVPRDVYSSGSTALKRCEDARHQCIVSLEKGVHGDA